MKTMMMLVLVAMAAVMGEAVSAAAGPPGGDYIHALANGRAPSGLDGVLLNGADRINTVETFKPPVDITVVARTDSTNLRLAYAADEIIFNWERNPAQFRIAGGPSNGKHKSGAGLIPKNQDVTIRWVVEPGWQRVYVDGDLRFEDRGDFSKIDRPVSVFCWKSKVRVKSIKVKPGPSGLPMAAATPRAPQPAATTPRPSAPSVPRPTVKTTIH